MIDAKTLRLITQNGLQAFAQGRILDGIAALQSLLPECADRSVIFAEVESLEKNYHYMLSFLRNGGDDEKRGVVQKKIQRTGTFLLEQINRMTRLQRGEDRYSETFHRLQNTYAAPLTDLFKKWDNLLTPEERADVQDELFDLLWTSDFWTSQDMAHWYDFILEQHDMVQQHLAGALFLALWEHYDREKMQLLYLLTESECERTRITSVAYSLFLRLRHKEINSLLPPLPDCCLAKGSNLVADTFCWTVNMLLSEKDLNDELEEEAKINARYVNTWDEGETAHIKALVTLKARYMRNRIQRRLDPNLNKVSLLHNCKYLKRVAHWFLPFDKNHQLFQSLMIDKKGNEKQQLSKLVDLMMDCNVDKLALIYLTANEREYSGAARMLEQHSPLDLTNAVVPKYTMRYVIQDLFRFFTHSPLSRQLSNPFREELTMFDFPEMAAHIHAKACLVCCEFLLELERPKQVVAALDMLIKRDGASASVLLLKGQALKQMKQYREAISCARSAELLELDNTNILQFLADCYKVLHRYEEVLEYLQRIAEIHPGNRTLDFLIAGTMSEVGREDEALQMLFKLDYESTENDEDHGDVLSYIADIALSVGKLDIAERYTEKAQEYFGGSHALSKLRAGHIMLLRGDWKGSLDNYQAFLSLYCQQEKKDMSYALHRWNSDRKMLIEKGIEEADLMLIFDILQGGINSSSQSIPT